MTQTEHRPVITDETFRRLDVYRAQLGLQNSDEAIEHLLNRVGDLEDE